MFDGTTDLALVEEWISMIEKIFEFLLIKDVNKVNCTMFMLRNDGRIW